MPLKKRYLKKKTICKVTFILPNDIDAKSAYVVGEFNNWEKTTTPMSKEQDGTWKVNVNLEVDRRFQYRYLVNGTTWHNDFEADEYVPHPYGGENSVVIT